MPRSWRRRELNVVAGTETIRARPLSSTIGTALAAKADFLVTGDRGLLDVGAYQGVRIVGVAEALGIITPR